MCDLGEELYNEGRKGRHLVRHTLISRKQETESSEAVPGSPADRGQEVLTSEGWAAIAWGKAKAPGWIQSPQKPWGNKHGFRQPAEHPDIWKDEEQPRSSLSQTVTTSKYHMIISCL